MTATVKPAAATASTEASIVITTVESNIAKWAAAAVARAVAGAKAMAAVTQAIQTKKAVTTSATLTPPDHTDDFNQDEID